MSRPTIARVGWNMLTRSERRAAVIVGCQLLIGSVLEVASIGLVFPLVIVLSQSNFKEKYPIVVKLFGNASQERVLIYVLLIVLIVFVVRFLYSTLSLWYQRGFAADVQERLASDLFVSYMRQPYSFHLVRNSSLLSRNVRNSAQFIGGVIDPLFVVATDGVVLVAMSVLLMWMQPIVMAVTLSVLSFVAWLFHAMSKQQISRWGSDRQTLDGYYFQTIDEGFGGIKDILILGRTRFFESRFNKINHQIAHSQRRLTMVNGIPRLYFELLVIIGLVTLVMTYLLLGQSTSSLPPLLGLFGAATFRIMPALNRIVTALQALRYSEAVITTLDDDLRGMNKNFVDFEDDNSVSFYREISIENLVFSYENSSRNALDKVSFVINKGQSVGIVGPSGAGKSSLVDVLLGLLPSAEGRILIDGIDVRENLRAWQNIIGYVPQSIYLTDASIRDNIALGIEDGEIDDCKIDRAVKAAQLSEFVLSLEHGISTMVGERGVRLSGGQRQRIGIARALYNDPLVLVLDEATSSLDTQTEEEVMKSITKLHGLKTIIIVAHRLSTISSCDSVLVLEEGRLQFQGSYSEVVSRIGIQSSMSGKFDWGRHD